MKKTVLLSVLFLFTGIAYAQITRTVGTGGNYATLKLAFDSINAGTLTGDVTLNIISDITDNNSAVLYGSGTGASSYTSVLIEPTGLPPDGNWTLTANINLSIIDLDGAQNVTINGQLDGASWEQNLYLVNNGATNQGEVIVFRGNAIYNTVEYCHLTCNNLTSSGAVNFALGSSSTQGNSHNLIDHCDISRTLTGGMNNGITSTSSWNTNNVIMSCKIYDWRVVGINLSPNCGRGWIIGGSSELGGNHFYQTSTFSSPGEHYAIKVTDSDSVAITGNYIGGGSPYCGIPEWTNTNTTDASYGIYVSGTSGADTFYINSNRIHNMGFSGPGYTAIEVHGTKLSIGNYGPNQIGGNSSYSEIKMNGTGYLMGIHAWADAGAPDFNISNNVVQQLKINNTSNSQPVTGISLSSSMNGTLMAIENNVVQDIRSNGNSTALAVRGIGVTANYSTFSLSGNVISRLTESNGGGNAAKVKGITLDADNSNITLSRNQITEMRNNCTGSTGNAEIVGIQVYYLNGNITASNNMISITNDENTNDINIYGIWDQGISGTGFGVHHYYFNSIYIGGMTIGYGAAACYRRDADLASVLVNNVFFNDRFSIDPAKTLAMIVNSNNSTYISSNHNDLFTRDADYVCSADGGSTALSLASWKTAFTPNTDLASRNLYPKFTSHTDLRIIGNAYLDNMGDPSTGIYDDIDWITRSGLTPDPGISEFSYNSYTVGTGGDFVSLKHAFDRINDGTITGNIQLEIISDISFFNHDSVCELHASGTGTPASDYSQVLIQPGGTLLPPTTLSWRMYLERTGPIIILDGAANVTFDGRIQGATTGRNLALENLGVYHDNGEVVRFQNGANSNTIKNCVIIAENQGIFGAIHFGSSGASISGNSYNTIENCDISPGSEKLRNAIYCDSTEHNNNWNIIRNCNIYNWTDHGILISRPILPGDGWVEYGNDSWWITGNSFYRSDSDIPDRGVAIELQKGNSHQILNNFIGGTEPGANGASSSISSGITVMGTYYNYPGLPDYIEGNIIRRIHSSVFKGIYVLAQNVDIGSVQGNIIGDSLLADAVWCNGPGTFGIYILNHLDNVANIRNNMVANMVDSAWSDGDALVGIGTIRNGTASFIGCNGEISNNRIFALKDMCATTIYNGTYLPAHPKVFGIIAKGKNLTVRNNKIYDLRVELSLWPEVNDTVVGIATESHPGSYYDSCMIYNNMISLGSHSSNCLMESHIGLLETSIGQGHNYYYYNSVYINGACVGNENSTFCFLKKSYAGSFTANIYNNLFINSRVSIYTGWGRGNYAIGSGDNAGVYSNHNDLYSGTPAYLGTVHAGQYPLSFEGWQSAFLHPVDQLSVSILPSFVSTANDLRCTGPEDLDNLGICIDGIHDDILGNVRQNPPDMGINEFDVKIYKTWLGLFPYWDTPLNWSPAGLPTASDNVRLTPGINYNPTIRNPGAICKDLLIEPDVHLSTNPGTSLDIMGVFVLVKYCP
ncbi:MAG: hypothetical protein NTX61_16615 [Bacteroidetes bacterium]|nr:hypothetical protein [Bacteroidota bacterium]